MFEVKGAVSWYHSILLDNLSLIRDETSRWLRANARIIEGRRIDLAPDNPVGN